MYRIHRVFLFCFVLILEYLHRPYQFSSTLLLINSLNAPNSYAHPSNTGSHKELSCLYKANHLVTNLILPLSFPGSLCYGHISYLHLKHTNWAPAVKILETSGVSQLSSQVNSSQAFILPLEFPACTVTHSLPSLLISFMSLFTSSNNHTD